MERYLLIAVLVMNLITFLAYGLDKWKAARGRPRLPEAHLCLLAAATGAVGAWLGMSVFRHKTRKLSFKLKLLLATAVNGLWIWLWVR